MTSLIYSIMISIPIYHNFKTSKQIVKYLLIYSMLQTCCDIILLFLVTRIMIVISIALLNINLY